MNEPVFEVVPVTADRCADAEAMFDANPDSAACFCTWFMIPVAQHHAIGPEGNRQIFRDLVRASDTPVGVLAFVDGAPVGWCSVGPRSRFARALKVPSFKGRDREEDDDVWLVPCFNVRTEHRRSGVSRALLEGAIDVAREHAATAVEGFPFARGAKLGRESMVGTEATFERCGFSATRRPSATRVVMRLQLARP